MCNTFAVYFQIFATFGYKKVKNSDNYDVAKMTPFQIVTLAKDELLRRDHTDYSILVFVLKGTVRVSTSVYVKDNVENGNMFVVHEHDYICVRGGG